MFSTPRHGEVRGVRTPWEGTFFTFFSGSVRAPNRFPTPPPGHPRNPPGGGVPDPRIGTLGWYRDPGSRPRSMMLSIAMSGPRRANSPSSRTPSPMLLRDACLHAWRRCTRARTTTANGFAETRHRSSSRSSLALDRTPTDERVRSEIASKLARSASIWHKDQHGIDSAHGSILSTPPHDLRSLGAIANFVRRSRSASSIDLRSLRDRSDLASSDTFARANVMRSSDRS